jgi:hypothetical protein
MNGEKFAIRHPCFDQYGAFAQRCIDFRSPAV